MVQFLTDFRQNWGLPSACKKEISPIELFVILPPIALLDSLSIVPLCLVLLVMLLGGADPLVRSAALLFGIFLTYLACGLLILFGLQSVFDVVDTYVQRLWHDPNTEELIFQILLGLVMVIFGVRIAQARKARNEKPVATGMTAGQALWTGAGLTIVGMPGAVPYFAGIDFIIRSDVTASQEVSALIYYNIVFVVPLAAIVALRLILGERSEGILDAAKGFLDKWGRRTIVGLLLALGAVLVVDGVGWFLGTPLIPV